MTPKAKKYGGAAEVLAGLKDFQRDTVEYVFGRLFTDPEPTRRFLVADEVGLGKTLVARGVIAKAIEHLQDQVRRVDVLYICSNAEIARQNIQKLNVTGDKDFQLASRITLLPLTLRDLTSRRLNFASFTPGTSFDLRSNLGLREERVVLYWLLRHAWGEAIMRGVGPLKVLRGNVGMERFGRRVEGFDQTSLDRGLSAKFKAALLANDRDAQARGETGLKQRFRELAEHLRYRKIVAKSDARKRSALIGELRALLARTCVDALEPDLIILDEFQRFRELLDGDDPASELAQHLFDYEGARVRCCLQRPTRWSHSPMRPATRTIIETSSGPCSSSWARREPTRSTGSCGGSGGSYYARRVWMSTAPTSIGRRLKRAFVA